MTNGTISLLTCDRDNKYWLAWMEATMPSSITQLVSQRRRNRQRRRCAVPHYHQVRDAWGGVRIPDGR
jgi:hypothetical protein